MGEGALSVNAVAKLFFGNVVRFLGVPIEVISERDPRFTVFFGRSCGNLGTKLLMSSAYHPQIDWQLENTHRTLEQTLRCLLSEGSLCKGRPYKCKH